MQFINVLAVLYLIVGLAYGIYVLFNGSDRWYMFIINVLGGPLVMLYLIYATLTRKRIPTGD